MSLSDKSKAELESLAERCWHNHAEANKARKAQGGRRTDTQMDEFMKDQLSLLRDIDKELLSRE